MWSGIKLGSNSFRFCVHVPCVGVFFRVLCVCVCARASAQVFVQHMCIFICVVYLYVYLLYVCDHKHVSDTQELKA